MFPHDVTEINLNRLKQAKKSVHVTGRSSSRNNSRSPARKKKDIPIKFAREKDENPCPNRPADGTQSIGEKFIPHRLPESSPCSSAKAARVEVPRVRGEDGARAASNAEYFQMKGSAPDLPYEYTDLSMVIRQENNTSTFMVKQDHNRSTQNDVEGSVVCLSTMPLSTSKQQHYNYQADILMTSHRHRTSLLHSQALGDSTLESKKEPKQRATDRESYAENHGGLDSQLVGGITIKNSPRRKETTSVDELAQSLHEVRPPVPDHILVEAGMTTFPASLRSPTQELEGSLRSHHARQLNSIYSSVLSTGRDEGLSPSGQRARGIPAAADQVSPSA